MKNRIGVNPKTNQRKLTIKLLIRKMKKFIYAISAFAVIFAVGCSKDEVEKPAPEYDLVVNMEKPSFGDDTRAARTSWEDGDVVYVVFNEDAKDSKYLALTYNAGSWTSKWEGTTAEAVAAKGSGTLKAGYMNVPLNNTNYISGVGLMFYANAVNYNGVCVMLCNDGTYTVSGNTISLDITMKPFCAQVTVKGLDIDDNWVLSSDGLIDMGGFGLSDSSVSPNAQHQGGELHGFANVDGVSFYGMSWSNETRNIKFTLTNGEKTYTRTFNSKKLTDGMAIIMDGPSTSSDWVEK